MTPDTIAAIATPAGAGGVGVVRLSGPRAQAIARALTGKPCPPPRYARLTAFLDADGSPIDEGLLLYFPAPASFTGEDVVECQGHGGALIMDLLLQRVLSLGARMAHPGEFSQRAFLNGKLDLAQAEAVADLIAASTVEAARSATRALQGEFSRLVDTLAEDILRLRVYVEAAIDFPEEDIDFLSEGKVGEDILSLIARLEDVRKSTQSGVLLRDGIRLVIAGRPNAGKSSLLNALAGREAAIVTDLPGTTRDLVREQIQIDGIPLHLVDTAGLRDTLDAVEREGVRRAKAEIATADLLLWVYDDRDPGYEADLVNAGLADLDRLVLVANKTDLSGRPPGVDRVGKRDRVAVSAKAGEGLDALRRLLKDKAGFRDSDSGLFIARRRHLDALERAGGHLAAADSAFRAGKAGELIAEDLRLAHQSLGEITGQVTSDALLGEIFASFCIGK